MCHSVATMIYHHRHHSSQEELRALSLYRPFSFEICRTEPDVGA